ncbi:MAG: hypothetical protein ABSF70_15010 [Terracidiphilus sp.]|jgi:hypothetical protein
MSSDFLIKLIEAVCVAAVTAAVPPAFTALSNRRTQHLSARRDAFLGRWEGEGSDFYIKDSSQPKTTFTLSLTFTSVGRTIKADGILQEAGAATPDQLSFSGTFYNDDYIQLSYANKSLARKQLGVVVAGLSPDGLTQTGYYAGFSSGRAAVVAGEITIKKKA